MGREWDIEVDLGHLNLTDETRERLVARLSEENVKRMRDGLGADGEELGEGVDLYRTGALQDPKNRTVDRAGYSFDVAHAEEVEARYHFAGLPDDVVEGLSRELEAIIGDDGAELGPSPMPEED